jgi:hypothetical protein
VPWELYLPAKKTDSAKWEMDWRSPKGNKEIWVLYLNERKEYLEKLDRYYYDEVSAVLYLLRLNTMIAEAALTNSFTKLQIGPHRLPTPQSSSAYVGTRLATLQLFS